VRTLGRAAAERNVLAGFIVTAVYAALSLAAPVAPELCPRDAPEDGDGRRRPVSRRARWIASLG
jgi:hypothetical protein